MVDKQRNGAAALWAVRNLVGDPEADVDDEDIVVLPFPDRPLEEWQKRARDSRPEAHLIAADHLQGIGWKRLRLADMLPDFGVLTSVYLIYTSDSQRPEIGYSTTGGTAAVGMRQALDLGVRAGRYSQARHELLGKNARHRQWFGFIEIDTAKSWLDLRHANGRVKLAARAEKLGTGWLVAVDQNMAAGIFTDGRTMWEALQSWVGLRMGHVAAIHDQALAVVALARAVGAPVLEGGP
jgi:outer membrane protein TolC